MAQNIWTLAFVLGLMKTRLDFFHGGTQRWVFWNASFAPVKGQFPLATHRSSGEEKTQRFSHKLLGNIQGPPGEILQ